MIENPTTQERPRPITAQQARKRRDSKTLYRNNGGPRSHQVPRHRDVVDGRTSRSSRSPGSPPSPRNGRIAPSSSQDTFFNFEPFDALSLSSPALIGNPTFPSTGLQNEPVDDPWLFQSMVQYPMGSPTQFSPPFSPPLLQHNNNSFPFGGSPTGIQQNNLDFSWNGATPSTSYEASELDIISLASELQNSYGSSMFLDTPETESSSLSGSWVMPITDCGTDFSGGMSQVNDLALTPDFFQTGLPSNLTSHSIPNDSFPLETFPYDRNTFPQQHGRLFGEIYSTSEAQLSTATLTQQAMTLYSDTSSMIEQIPWNSQQAQLSTYLANANPGQVAYEPDRGAPYQIHMERERRYFDDTGQQMIPRTFGPEPLQMVSESEDESLMDWSGGSSYTMSHESPHSLGSPLSYAASPLQTRADHHPHMLSAFLEPEETKPKFRRRKLSPAERVQARGVRECKACWGCHLSKTKCSPCGPGRPCELCATLAGKRRFCKFSCFNDPLESLSIFWVPEWFTGHFTQENVESFIDRDTSKWGTQNIPVRLSWGYHKPIEADVVALELRGDAEQIGISNQAVSLDGGRPQLVRRKSPPLGVPLGSMMEMKAVSTQYTQRIVDEDLLQYVEVAYDDQESALPERLLGAIGTFYRANARAGRKSELLCQAIEIHITFTILERSLVLDPESIQQVQNHLQQVYPARAVPRCAQRQIKLAFFLIQRQRIENVLKNWSSMMWLIKNTQRTQREWALSCSVFMVLTLALDKIFGAAFYFCQGNIKNYDGVKSWEEKQLDELVTLAEREFFDRCKEIFHWKFKTRKTEGCNPIRYGLAVFRSWDVDAATMGLVGDLRAIVRDFEMDIRAHRSWRSEPPEDDSPYLDAGRLACIFLDDFLEH